MCVLALSVIFSCDSDLYNSLNYSPQAERKEHVFVVTKNYISAKKTLNTPFGKVSTYLRSVGLMSWKYIVCIATMWVSCGRVHFVTLNNDINTNDTWIQVHPVHWCCWWKSKHSGWYQNWLVTRNCLLIKSEPCFIFVKTRLLPQEAEVCPSQDTTSKRSSRFPPGEFFLILHEQYKSQGILWNLHPLGTHHFFSWQSIQ